MVLLGGRGFSPDVKALQNTGFRVFCVRRFFACPPKEGRKPLKNASRRLALHLLNGFQLEGFSVERLMNFLTALDRDVDIVIRRRPGTRRAGRIVVTAAQEGRETGNQ
jgi:hypothetical protein